MAFSFLKIIGDIRWMPWLFMEIGINLRCCFLNIELCAVAKILDFFDKLVQ